MDTPRLYWYQGDAPNAIATYMCCKHCALERPPNESVSEHSRLSVGLQANGNIQIWCERHQCSVAILSGQPHPGEDYGDETPIDPANCCQHPDHEVPR